jgi:hypothetical protein
MPTVFLSYRRNDTGGEVGRLSDSLKQKIGGKFVFRDVADIPAGAAFDAVLDKELADAKLVLVLIGPAWLGELKQRLEQAGIDYVRLEVAAALSKGKRVIPLLLRGTPLPPAEALPQDLAPLAKRQAMALHDESWSSDVDRLIDAIGRPYRWNLLAVRAVVASLAIVVAVWALVPQFAVERVSDYNFLRWLVLSLVGIYGLMELVIGYLYFRKLKQLENPSGRAAQASQ